eukprot:NODE_343_length_9136_cov_0.948656.p1 type:complete len:480 gc:universal NODE_343_length_9136_cov_0.948656:8014-6575(-)
MTYLEMTILEEFAAASIIKEMLASNHGWPFEEPVDPVKLDIPDYLDVIKNPIDLSTIYMKILDSKYSNFQEFHDDICLMFRNAHDYNDPDSDIVETTQELELVYVQCLYNHGFPLITEDLDVPRRRKIIKVNRSMIDMDVDVEDIDQELLEEIDQELDMEVTKKRRKKKNDDESEEEFDLEKISSASSHSESTSIEQELDIDEYEISGVAPPERLIQIQQQRQMEQQRQLQQQQQHYPQQNRQRLEAQSQNMHALQQVAHSQAMLRIVYDFVTTMAADVANLDDEDKKMLQYHKSMYGELWKQAQTNGTLSVKIDPLPFQNSFYTLVNTFATKIDSKYTKYLQPQLDKAKGFKEKYDAQQKALREQQQAAIMSQQQQQLMYMQQSFPQGGQTAYRSGYTGPVNNSQSTNIIPGGQLNLANDPLIQQANMQNISIGFGQQNSISPSKVLGSFSEPAKSTKSPTTPESMTSAKSEKSENKK